MNIERIQNLFNEVGNALAKLEQEIRVTLDTPRENINRDDFSLANIPDNYIRTGEYYRINYNLSNLLNNKTQIDNIAYSLQLSDFFNYIINRLNIYGVIKNLFIKSAIINIFSIEEGLLYSSLMSLNSYCWFDEKVCNLNSNCKYYVKARNQLTFNSLMQTFQDKIGFHHERYREIMFRLKEIRDNVHLEDVKFNEWAENEKYSLNQYNEAILTLRYLKFQLHRSLADFRRNRDEGCKKTEPNKK